MLFIYLSLFLLPAPHGVRVMWAGGGGDLSPTLSVITNWTGKKHQCSKISNKEFQVLTEAVCAGVPPLPRPLPPQPVLHISHIRPPGRGPPGETGAVQVYNTGCRCLVVSLRKICV